MPFSDNFNFISGKAQQAYKTITPLFSGKSSLISGKQAQQVYRFILRIKGVDAALIQNVSSPKYKIDTEKHNIAGYEVNYPTKVTWQSPITFEIIQILDDQLLTSTLGFFMQKLYDSNFYASPLGIGTGEKDFVIPNSAYNIRNQISNFLNNGPSAGYKRESGEGTVLDLSKEKLTSVLGTPEIKMLDENGQIFESWRLNGAFISAITPSDLTYNNENLSTVKVEITYDWADYGFRGVYAEEDSVLRILGI